MAGSGTWLCEGEQAISGAIVTMKQELLASPDVKERWTVAPFEMSQQSRS
jgi:hypothetical protein